MKALKTQWYKFNIVEDFVSKSIIIRSIKNSYFNRNFNQFYLIWIDSVRPKRNDFFSKLVPTAPVSRAQRYLFTSEYGNLRTHIYSRVELLSRSRIKSTKSTCKSSQVLEITCLK